MQQIQKVDAQKGVGRQQQFDVSLLQAEGQLFSLEPGIDRHRHRADQGAGVEQLQPVAAIAQKDADMVATAHTGRIQRPRA
ncbi:hypothetical protein D3C73_945090 [compost metagenome]